MVNISGDDQDLDDKIIHELWIENRELKEELDTLKTTKEHSDAKEGEVLEPVISRLCLCKKSYAENHT